MNRFDYQFPVRFDQIVDPRHMPDGLLHYLLIDCSVEMIKDFFYKYLPAFRMPDKKNTMFPVDIGYLFVV